MLRRLTMFFALLLQLGTTAPAAASGDHDPRAYRVTRPGEVLFERAARAELLADLSPEQRTTWCGPATESWRSHKAKTKLKTPADDDLQTDERSEPFAWTIMTAAAAAFGQGDPDAREALTGNLRRWARGEALTKLKDRQENTYYSLERTLLPTIVAYGLVRDDPDWDESERKEVERWLNRLVRLRGVKRPDETRGPISQMNNHRYLSDSVDMAWGALRGNDALFRQGIESFLLALAQMRPDGSLPLETERGSKALWYQRQAVSSLVTIAEMAAVQGYDLYAIAVEGKSLHRTIDFLGASDRRAGARHALRAREPETRRVRELPGPGPELHAAPGSRPPLHGLVRALPGALPRARRDPPADAPARRVRRSIPAHGRRLQRRQHELLLRARRRGS